MVISMFNFDWGQLQHNVELKQKVESSINETLSKAFRGLSGLSLSLDSLDVGSRPPDLRITNIDALTMKDVQLAFAFEYKGEANLSFRADVSIDPLKSSLPNAEVSRRGRRHLGVMFKAGRQQLKVVAGVSSINLKGGVVVHLHKGEGKDDSSVSIQLQNQPLQDIAFTLNGKNINSVVQNLVCKGLKMLLDKIRQEPIVVHI